MKTPLQPTTLLLDLSGKYSWIDCSAGVYISSTHHYIPCDSHQCNSLTSLACSDDCFDQAGPGCHSSSCGLFPENPVIKNTVLAQALVDTVGLSVTDGSSVTGKVGVVPNFVLSCSDTSLLRGLPDGVSGLAGLGRFNYSLPSQVSKVFNSPQVFALCLPSCPNTTEYSGAAFFNTRGPYNFASGVDLSSHLSYTPLIINPIGFTLITYFNYPSAEYFIGLTSIKIDGKQVDINPSLLTIDNNGYGGTRLSTITPYTTLHTSIYRPFIQLFINESMTHNLTISTNPVSPFEVCFNASGMHKTWFGPKVPVIDLVMHSEDVFWKVYGSNSMVKVEGEYGEGLWCLGFVDGGDEARTSVVIGGKQMEDNMLQFDLENERLGFSSILEHKSSCIEFNFTDGYWSQPSL
ncbi:aspartic peptidase A1 family [Artemisia annua]|uniref:Aspartic peptidase A1 family n=1 Tax=Artemisia annua TaxID=35608 RepID=A0A2U1PS11_ARTAN|nr:aspartic peptidase A1 family [Artemisia annua]